MNRLALPLVAAVLFAVGSATASAEPAAPPAENGRNDKEDIGDSGRTICRSVEQIGTRFGAKKVCATAAEWAAMRAQQREGTERVQSGRWKSD